MQTVGGTPIAADRARRRAGIIALAVIAADQITKAAVVAYLPEGDSRPVISDILRLSHIRNTGAAFGMLRGLGGMLVLAALAGVMAFVIVVLRRPAPLTGFGAALVASGATGNLLDRLFRDGGVVDFVDFRYWPAFNVADSAITIGALLLLWAGFKEGAERAPAPEPDRDESARHGR